MADGLARLSLSMGRSETWNALVFTRKNRAFHLIHFYDDMCNVNIEKESNCLGSNCYYICIFICKQNFDLKALVSL